VSCLPFAGLPLQCSHSRHPSINAKYTLMPLAVHAIWGAASASTTEHQRRRPRMAGDRAGKHNRRFIGALVERFHLSATCFCAPSPGMAERLSPSLGHAIVRATQRRTSSSSGPMNGTPRRLERVRRGCVLRQPCRVWIRLRSGRSRVECRVRGTTPTPRLFSGHRCIPPKATRTRSGGGLS
jgi:hypothetical protein